MAGSSPAMSDTLGRTGQMDFDLTEEQRLLKESLDRLIGDRYAFEQRKNYAQAPEGWSRELWRQYAELGLLGLPFAEQYGGSAGGPVAPTYFNTRKVSIYGGTNEIQKNIIAKAILGL